MFPSLDPSKMDPKTLAELSQLMRELPPDRIMRMQSLMHNMMAGFDVRKDMEEFERTLPADFRERLMRIAGQAGPAFGAASAAAPSAPAPSPSQGMAQTMDEREARLTVLRAVANGSLSPEEAERLL